MGAEGTPDPPGPRDPRPRVPPGVRTLRVRGLGLHHAAGEAAPHHHLPPRAAARVSGETRDPRTPTEPPGPSDPPGTPPHAGDPGVRAPSPPPPTLFCTIPTVQSAAALPVTLATPWPMGSPGGRCRGDRRGGLWGYARELGGETCTGANMRAHKHMCTHTRAPTRVHRHRRVCTGSHVCASAHTRVSPPYVCTLTLVSFCPRVPLHADVALARARAGVRPGRAAPGAERGRSPSPGGAARGRPAVPDRAAGAAGAPW